MAKTGRPKIILTEEQWEMIEKMSRIMCTGEEIAGVLGISYDTLERRVKEQYGIAFAEYIKQFHNQGKTSLRRWQFKSAQNGSVPMQIWLGKQYLGQKEQAQVDGKQSITLNYNLDDDE